MQTAARLCATRQRDVERFGGQLRLELAALQFVATRVARSGRFDPVLGDVDRRAGGLALFRRQLAPVP